jgi:hypothetical protein
LIYTLSATLIALCQTLLLKNKAVRKRLDLPPVETKAIKPLPGNFLSVKPLGLSEAIQQLKNKV